jgi:hypothetical protein
MVWGIGAIALLAGLYGLHRLALWLEDRGLLYYLRRKPKGGIGPAFLAMQRAVEPGIVHVETVRAHADDAAPKPGGGVGTPPDLTLERRDQV